MLGIEQYGNLQLITSRAREGNLTPSASHPQGEGVGMYRRENRNKDWERENLDINRTDNNYEVQCVIVSVHCY